MNKTNRKRYRLTILALLVLVLAGCVGGRQGVSWPSVGMVELNGEQNIVVSYTDQVAIISPSNGAPARVYNSDGEVRTQEGEPLKWVLLGSEHEGAQFYTNPIRIDDELFLIADYNKKLLEVPTTDLNVERTIPIADHILADILVEDGVMYIPYQAHGLTAMTLDGYEELWTFPTKEGVWAKPLLIGDMIVFTSLDHHVYAVDKNSGELIWSADLEGGVTSTPLLANDHLYVGSYNKKLFELSLDGEILNSSETENWVWGTPAIDDEGILYVADLSGYVHALDTNNDLSKVWSVKVATRGIRPGPIVYGEHVIVASRDGVVYWIDRRDGLTAVDKEVEGNPELLGDLLLLEPSETLDISDALVVVSSADTGKLLVAFRADGLQTTATWVYGH